MKQNDCQNDSIAKTISFGVNDSKVKRDDDKKKFKNKRFMELNSISFRHVANNFTLGNLELGNFPISVSYDRTGNILIGMDILKNLEIYIGKKHKDETVLIACKQKTKEFFALLSELADAKKV